MIQLAVLTSTAIGALIGAAMTRIRAQDTVLHPPTFDKHRIMGICVIGLTFLQVAIGYGMHLRRTNTLPFDPRPGTEFAARRTWINWIHIALGLSLLTLAGLTATWAFVDFKLEPKPIWIQIVNWCLVGLPPIVVLPLVLWRGHGRLKTGHTFAQAFFNAPVPSVDFVSPRAPRSFMNEADYLVESAVLGRHAPVSEFMNEQGFAYAPDTGAGGRQLVSGSGYCEPSWQGVATREDYELHLRATAGQPQVLYDAPPMQDERNDKTKGSESQDESIISKTHTSNTASLVPTLPPIEPLFSPSSSSQKPRRVPVPDLVEPLSPASPLNLTLPTSPSCPTITSRALSPLAVSGSSIAVPTLIEQTPTLSVVGSDGHNDGDENEQEAVAKDVRLQREASGRWFGNRRA
ncbi:hypothetical protein OIV83_002168 [Microbotryomycetes sp. JL201]|nr:hypothetical protein OIV83_002168 [Microbotryomycetes sp. JL201]